MTTTPEGRRELKALAEKATPGPWHHCQPYMVVPSQRTIHGPVPAERVDYVSTWPDRGTPPGHRVVIPMPREAGPGVRSDDMAFIAAANPATVLSLLAALEEAEGREAEQTKAFDLLVSTVLAARTTNTRAYMEGLADDLNVALAAFGDPDRVAFERGSFSIIRATTKSGEASE